MHHHHQPFLLLLLVSLLSIISVNAVPVPMPIAANDPPNPTAIDIDINKLPYEDRSEIAKAEYKFKKCIGKAEATSLYFLQAGHATEFSHTSPIGVKVMCHRERHQRMEAIKKREEIRERLAQMDDDDAARNWAAAGYRVCVADAKRLEQELTEKRDQLSRDTKYTQMQTCKAEYAWLMNTINKRSENAQQQQQQTSPQQRQVAKSEKPAENTNSNAVNQFSLGLGDVEKTIERSLIHAKQATLDYARSGTFQVSAGAMLNGLKKGPVVPGAKTAMVPM